MRRFLWASILIVAGFLVPKPASAQMTYYENTAIGSTGRPIAGAKIAVCTDAGVVGTSTTPCSPLAEIFTDVTGGMDASNPFTADGLGNYHFWGQPGQYTIQIYGTNIGATLYPLTITCSPTGMMCGGSAIPGGAAGAIQFNNNGVLGGQTNIIDCLAYDTGELGATLNACIAAAPPGATVTVANIPNSHLTLSTEVDVNSAVTVLCGGVTITQTAAITVGGFGAGFVGSPGQLCNLVKNANLDQLTFTNGDSGIVQYVYFSGNKASFTGDQIVILTGATHVEVNHNTFDGGAGSAINASGAAFNTQLSGNIHDNLFLNYGTHALLTSNGEWNFDNNGASDDGTATGELIDIVGGGVSMTGNRFSNLTSAQTTILNSGNSTFRGGLIVAFGNYPAIINNSGMVITNNTQIFGGGTHGPAIEGNDVETIANNINISAATGGNPIEIVNGENTWVIGNGIGLKPTTGKCGIKLLADSIGVHIESNTILFDAGESPTGDNYGVCVTTSTGHLLSNYVVHNTVNGANSNAHDVGFLYDNSAGATASFVRSNLFQDNQCVDCNRVIVQTDSTNAVVNYYENNEAVATPNLFGSGGAGTTSIVTDIHAGEAFANIGTPGNGSQIYCTDCNSSATAGGSTGQMIFRTNGAWVVVSGTAWSALTAGTNSNAGTFAFSGNAFDASAASHTKPSVVVAASGSLPGSCVSGELGFVTGATAGQNLYMCNGGVWTQQLNSGTAGASTSLGNLAAVAINTTLLPAAVNTVALGSNSLSFTNIFVGTVANQTLSFGTGSLTANRAATWPDNSGIVAELNLAQTWTANQTFPAVLSSTANPASAGFLRLAVADLIEWRNNANSGNITLVPDSNNLLTTSVGYKSPIYRTTTANPAATGIIQLASADTACWRNNGNSADLCLAKDSSDVFSIGGSNIVTSASTNTFTNKTFNAESTGNTLSEPVKAYFSAGGCNNSTAGPSMDIGTTNSPNPQCAGTTVRKGVLWFARGNTAYINWHLPPDWNASSATDIEMGFTTTDTTNGHVTSFNIQTACNKVDGTATDDPSLNALQALSVTTGASQISGGMLAGSKTGLTMTGCVADYNFEIAITRNNSGTDTNTDTAVAVKWAEVTVGVSKNSANR